MLDLTLNPIINGRCRKESKEMESERVKMESRRKLGNDGKVKFVGPEKV